jgi:hypothetical protein
MGRKKCKTCYGDKIVRNPKYKDENAFIYCFGGEPKDYHIQCPDCKGTGERGKHKEPDAKKED